MPGRARSAVKLRTIRRLTSGGCLSTMPVGGSGTVHRRVSAARLRPSCGPPAAPPARSTGLSASTAQTLAYSLWAAQPRPVASDPIAAIAELISQAEDAQRALSFAHHELGPGTSPSIRAQAAGLLRSAGFSLEQIATALGVTSVTISNDLRGRSLPAVPALQDLAATLSDLATLWRDRLGAGPPAVPGRPVRRVATGLPPAAT